ncbi:hypothetical protein EN788_71280, partial [Mesorhizobium sp. M2D.F.Ca.ET.145.01.1.1]
PPLPGTPPEMIGALIQQNAVPLTDFIQANSPEDEPFLCMAAPKLPNRLVRRRTACRSPPRA